MKGVEKDHLREMVGEFPLEETYRKIPYTIHRVCNDLTVNIGHGGIKGATLNPRDPETIWRRLYQKYSPYRKEANDEYKLLRNRAIISSNLSSLGATPDTRRAIERLRDLAKKEIDYVIDELEKEIQQDIEQIHHLREEVKEL